VVYGGGSVIREVENGDLEKVRMLVARSIRHSVAQTKDEAEFLIADVGTSLDAWRADPSNALHLLHENEGLIAGVILVKKYWNLCNLFVDPSAQRRGIGRSLLESVILICRQQSPRGKLMVNSSTVALPFYEACGFRQTGPGIERAGGCVPMEMAFESELLER
jgi:GNAT superfamily N-acetyltransferase